MEKDELRGGFLERINVTTSHGNICVYKKGTGAQRVVLIHGGGCDNAMLSWTEVIKEFTEEYTVYALDLLGYGKSDKPDGLCGSHFYDTHINAVREVVEALGLDKFILAGLSMGGAISIGYALKYPESVQALVPVDSWGISKKMPFHSLCNWYIHKTNFTITQYNWMAKSRRLAKWAISYSLIGDKNKITDAIVDEVWRACKEDGAGKSMLDYQRSSCTKEGTIPYYKDVLHQLTMSVVFVNGEKDPLVPVKDLVGLKDILPNGKVVILKGCKHWAVKEQPKEFFEVIRGLNI